MVVTISTMMPTGEIWDEFYRPAHLTQSSEPSGPARSPHAAMICVFAPFPLLHCTALGNPNLLCTYGSPSPL